MQKRKFTTITQLHEKNNLDLIRYVESSRHTYAKAVRETFYALKTSEDFNKSNFNTYLQNFYGITERTANSIISDTQGRFNSLKELKQYEAKQLEHKISYLKTHLIPKLVKKRNNNSKLLQSGSYALLTRQRNLRLKIVAKKNKLNRLKQKLSNLNYQLESSRLKLCFGTKKLLKQNHDKFIEQRDSQITFIGAKAETCCNQNLQLTYNRKNNQFSIKLRKDFGGYKSAKGNDRYVYGKVNFEITGNDITGKKSLGIYYSAAIEDSYGVFDSIYSYATIDLDIFLLRDNEIEVLAREADQKKKLQDMLKAREKYEELSKEIERKERSLEIDKKKKKELEEKLFGKDEK